MPHLAYVLIGSPDPDAALTRSESLSDAGYRCIQASDGHTVIALAASRIPDVILLGNFLSPIDALNIVQALKSGDATRTIPVVLIDQPLDTERMEQARRDGVDDILSHNDDIQELLARLPRLTRSSVMAAELARRVKTAAEFGVNVDPRQFRRGYPDRPEVMVAAAEGSILTGLGNVLGDAGFKAVMETSYFRTADALDEGRFDAAVILGGSGEDLGRAQYLCGHIRSNPRLFNLPTLVMTEKGKSGAERELYRGGAAMVLPTETDPAQLCTYIHMLVGRQRQRWTLRDPFKVTLAAATADATGAAYSESFWRVHLARCIEATIERGGNLAVAFLSIPTLPRVREEHGPAHAEILAHQLADWVTGMTRIEDTVARIGTDSYAILLPDTPQTEAERVLQRIIGILTNSEFHLGEEVMQVVHAWAEGGVASLQPGDTPKSLEARARANTV